MPAENGVTAGMIWINGGSFTMGDNRTYPEERPTEQVKLSGFWIDRHEVTNAQFRRFVEATGYVTMAERGLDPAACHRVGYQRPCITRVTILRQHVAFFTSRQRSCGTILQSTVINTRMKCACGGEPKQPEG